MKKIKRASKGDTSRVLQERPFRRWVKKLFRSWIKFHNCSCREEIIKVTDRLDEMEESIDIIARQIARHIKDGRW